MTSSLKYLPLCQLKASRANMRKTDKLADIAQLAASIEANGLLENLVVHLLANGSEDGPHFEVVAGGRRLAALQRLAKAKKIERDHAVACLVVAEAPVGTLVELSLTENFERVPTHPADQFAAFAKLHHDGRPAEDIAARFGITVAFVQQRLKLSSVSPKLIALYREGALTLDQLTAFTLASDHKTQEEVWFDSGYDELPVHLIRRLLTRSQVEATDRRAVFVGLAAYEAAGGTIVRDLFDSEHEGYLTDNQLLDRLVAEKLAKAAEDVRGEGWSWVAVMADIDYGHLARFRRIAPCEVSLGDADETRIAELGTRYDELVALVEEEGDESVNAELDTVTSELEVFRLRKESWSQEDKARAGAILSLDQDGTLSIQRGLLRAGEGTTPNEADTKPSRREKTGTAPFSEALLMDLSAHRTAALREMLAGQPQIAYLALLRCLVGDVFFGRRGGCLEIAANQTPVDRASQTVGTSHAAEAFLERHRAWSERLPEWENLWGWLGELDDTARADLLAHCVACTANDLHATDRGGLRHEDADMLVRQLGLDMADWWTPTEAFFMRLSKAQILAAVTEGASAKAARRLTDAKKERMAREAEKLLAKSRWLPARLKPASEPDCPEEQIART